MKRTIVLESLVLAVVLLVALVIRLEWISATMPYVGDLDEGQITAPALHILQTGDFNPHTFEYPTLPTYLTAAGFTLGYLHAAGRLKVRTTADIGSVGYPYYARTIVVYPARHLFAILSVLGLLFAGIVAREVCADRFAICLAPAVALLSGGYLYLSWTYINVDVAGAVFSLATLAYLFRRWDQPTAVRAIGIGVLCGLTIACKYSLYWILAPGLLTVLLTEREHRLAHCAMLVAAAVGAFLAAVPYALLDFRAFLEDVGGAVRHYAGGHAGFNAEPGFSQVAFYLHQFRKEFGLAWALFALAGAFAVLRSDWRRGVVLVSFPIAHVAYMSLQRAHFPRHMAGVVVIIAVLIAIGLIEVSRSITGMVGSRSWSERIPGRARSVGVLVAAALFLVWVPWRNVFSAYRPITDSRKVARRWIEENVPRGATVLVPEKLQMDTRSLRDDYNIVDVSLRDLESAVREAGPSAYVLIPKFGCDLRGGRQAEESAAAANASFMRFELHPLSQFGTNPVLVNYVEPVPRGNPQFAVAALGAGGR